MKDRILIFEEGHHPRFSYVKDTRPYDGIKNIIVNPDVRHLEGRVYQHHWKLVGGDVLEMDDAEKKAVDDALPDLSHIQYPKVVIREVIKEIPVDRIVDKIIHVEKKVYVDRPVEIIKIKDVTRYRTPTWNGIAIAFLILINFMIIYMQRG